jgi:alkaline phosphatase D
MPTFIFRGAAGADRSLTITRQGDRHDDGRGAAPRMTGTPHMRFHNARRGHLGCRSTPQAWRSEFRVVPSDAGPDAPLETTAGFVVAAGRASPA